MLHALRARGLLIAFRSDRKDGSGYEAYEKRRKECAFHHPILAPIVTLTVRQMNFK
jgi:hypothetical protein